MAVNLFINWYSDKDVRRYEELFNCFSKNEENTAIDKIYGYVDVKQNYPAPAKVTWLNIKGRPTFADYFYLINEVSGPDDINIIANTDIYFDEYGIELIKKNIHENECYALARWDIQPDGGAEHLNRRDTGDAWVFKGKVKKISECNFCLGIPGCDNSIAERIARAGYVVKNPSVDIKIFHLHLSGIRNYKTPKPYLLITPHKLNTDVVYRHLIKNKALLIAMGNNSEIIKIIASLGEINILDWTAEQDRDKKIIEECSEWRPDFIIMQLGGNVIVEETLKTIRKILTETILINWAIDMQEYKEYSKYFNHTFLTTDAAVTTIKYLSPSS